MSARPFHLGYFLNGTSAQAWNTPYGGPIGRQWSTGEFHVDAARILERGKFDFLLWEDGYHVPGHWAGGPDLYVERAVASPRLDTINIASFVAAKTSRIGLIPTLPTYAYPPYLLARLIGSLDSLSRGRGAWNAVTGASALAFRNFGHDTITPPDERYDHAMEYVELVKKLWDSWEPDSIRADAATGRFADPSRVHPVEYSGQHVQYSGTALISGPSPQGRPVIAQAGASPKGRLLAATHADIVVGVGTSVAEMKAYRDDVHRELVAQGRKTDEVRVMFTLSPIIGVTDEEAEARKRYRETEAQQRYESILANMSNTMDIDLSVLPMDEPLGESHLAGLKTDGQRSALEKFLRRANGRTLRELGVDQYVGRGRFQVCGSLDAVAAQMGEINEEIGADGFLLSDQAGLHNRRHMTELADGLVPALQRRGLVREEYGHAQLRENLLEF